MNSTTTGRHNVHPSAIEAELARIWRETAALDQQQGQDKSGEVSPRARVVLSNIIIFSLGGKSSAIDNLITELLIAHPSRFFVIELDLASHADRLETFLSSRCALAHSGKHVCSEEIYIHTPVSAAGLVPNLLLSLFRADVPAIMVFPNGLDETTIANAEHRQMFQELIRSVGKISDKVVFDGQPAANYHLLVTMLRMAIDSPDLNANDADFRLLRDLHWRRLERWRNLIAEQFEAAREPDLAERIGGVTFIGGWDEAGLARGILPSDAFIMSGWVASRLGFTPENKRQNGEVWEVSGCASKLLEHRKLVLRFEKQNTAPSRELTEVQFRVEAPDDNKKANESLLRIVRDPSSMTGQILWHDSGNIAEVARQVPFAYRGLSDLFIGEISTNQMYRLYEDTVRAGELLRKFLSKKLLLLKKSPLDGKDI